MVRVPIKERIGLCNAVKELFDDPDICVSFTDFCDDDGSSATAILIKDKTWRKPVLIKVDEMIRDLRLGFSQTRDIAGCIVAIFDIAYRYKVSGAFATIGS